MIKEIFYCIITGFLIIYIIWGIALDNFNPNKWSDSLTVYMVILSCLCSILMLMFYFVSKEKSK